MACNHNSTWPTQTDSELRCGAILTAQMGGNLTSLQVTISHLLQGEIHRVDLVACRKIVQCGTSGCTGNVSARCGGTWVPRCEAVCHVLDLRGDFSRATTSLWIVVKMHLLPYLDIPVGFLGVICRVNSRHSSGEDSVTEEYTE